eukprot:scaffold8526_cov153-Amphora_coffeaeformis.AAC.4
MKTFNDDVLQDLTTPGIPVWYHAYHQVFIPDRGPKKITEPKSRFPNYDSYHITCVNGRVFQSGGLPFDNNSMTTQRALP